MEAVIKNLDRSAFCKLVRLFLVNQALDQLSKKAAKGNVPLLGKSFGFLQGRFPQGDRDILLMEIS